MVMRPADGLASPWRGRVWCNPPYSEPLPWIEAMSEHRNGIMLLPAKSPETRWGQALLRAGDAFLFLRGRLLFHYEDGARSTGKWSPYLLVAFGADNARRLRMAEGSWPGVLMGRI